VIKNNQSLDTNNICHQVGTEGVNCPIKVNCGNISHQFWGDIPYACHLNTCIPSSMFNNKIPLFYFPIKIFTLYFLTSLGTRVCHNHSPDLAKIATCSHNDYSYSSPSLSCYLVSTNVNLF